VSPHPAYQLTPSVLLKFIIDEDNFLLVKVKVKQSLYGPSVFQEVEAPRFHGSRYMKVVRLSALRPGSLYPLGNIPGNHFC